MTVRCTGCGDLDHYYTFPYCGKCGRKMSSYHKNVAEHPGKPNLLTVKTFYSCEKHGELKPTMRNFCPHCNDEIYIQGMVVFMSNNYRIALMLAEKKEKEITDRFKCAIDLIKSRDKEDVSTFLYHVTFTDTIPDEFFSFNKVDGLGRITGQHINWDLHFIVLHIERMHLHV